MHESKDNLLSRRLNKVLESRFENDEETLEALKQLSSFYKENTIQARRNLRSQIEKQSLEINENFLSSLRDVKDSFESVYKDIMEINKQLQEMTTRVQNTKTHTRQLLDQTSSLQRDGLNNQIQQNIVTAFLQKFQLTSDEILILHGNKQNKNSPITKEIFSVLDKVHRIHENCKLLMQTGHQTLALDIMEQMTLHHEGALERMYRWTQNYCRNIDHPDYTELITLTMERLQDRNVLFKYILEEYCIARRDILVGDFINALTRGGPSGKPAPIETRSHDPQIYVTDMLVWLNKSIPIERNNIEMLVSRCVQTEDLNNELHLSLNNICEGICPTLKVRVEKILNTTNSPAVLYSVTNIIRYYKKCICKIVPGGALEATLTEFQNLSENKFFTTLIQQISNMLIRIESPQRDLSPTPAITHILAIMRDLLSTANMSEGRETDMIKIAQSILEPTLRAVNEQASRLPPTDMAVYLLNCMYSMYTHLSLYEFMEDILERLQAQSDAQIDTLTSEQASSLVANLSLGPIYTILQDQSQGPLSSIPGMEPSNLKKFLERLDYVISTPDSSILPQINLLSSSKHKHAIQKRAFDLIIAIYKQLHEGVNNPSNLYENPDFILSKSPEELLKLLNKHLL